MSHFSAPGFRRRWGLVLLGGLGDAVEGGLDGLFAVAVELAGGDEGVEGLVAAGGHGVQFVPEALPEELGVVDDLLLVLRGQILGGVGVEDRDAREERVRGTSRHDDKAKY